MGSPGLNKNRALEAEIEKLRSQITGDRGLAQEKRDEFSQRLEAGIRVGSTDKARENVAGLTSEFAEALKPVQRQRELLEAKEGSRRSLLTNRPNFNARTSLITRRK